MINDGGPAFPTPSGSSVGMSLRDWLAGQAMAGWLASYGPEATHPDVSGGLRDVAKQAYSTADAMLLARKGQ